MSLHQKSLAATQNDYLLGHDDHELARLEHQARMLGPATTALLRMAGICAGMRVLDLGTGAGDVALAAADVVGPTGSVVGIDRSSEAIATAQARAAARGATNITFTRSDVHEFADPDPFDAVVGRLVLLYVPDPAGVLRRHAEGVRSGGVVLAMEYDIPAARCLPACPTTTTAIGWVVEACGRAGLNTTLGPALASVFRAARLGDVTTIGIQPYLPAADGATMVAGIVRTLLPVLQSTGIATSDEVDIETLEQRLAAELTAHDAITIPPTLAGAWANVA